MKRLGSLLVVLVSVVAFVGGCGGGGDGGDGGGGGGEAATTSVPTTAAVEVDDEGAALRAWEAYRTAILAKDGPRAAGAVSQSTLDGYKTTIDQALTMDRAALDREDVMDVVMVMAVRLQFSAAEIEGLDGRRFFELGVQKGLIDESTVKELVFDSAEVDGDTARLGTSNSSQAARRMTMRKEANAWKVDLAGYMDLLGAQFNQMAEQEKLSRTDAAFKMLGLTPGSAEAERLLKPLKG